MTSTITAQKRFPDKYTAWFTKKIALGVTPAGLVVLGIMAFTTALHLTNIEAIGEANRYYTAAVESMLQSWENFFFVAAEPGGSVTVDKPPLGLWIEAVSAFFLGVNGFAVVLPNIVAGVLSIPLMYALVKKHLGSGAGVLAAMVLATTPVVVATDRNNTMDGMLTFTLLLAAWAFIEATERGKGHYLWLGAAIVGLGFNIKMLQAFLPLPAFYGLYFLGAKTSWGRKVFNLAVATGILVAVSLSWAVIVDLTPAEARPYIGSSTNNSVMELILGHNGASRLFGPSRGVSAPPGPSDGGSASFAGNPPQFNPGNGYVPADGDQPPSPPNQGGTGGPGNAGGGAFSFETGEAGWLRFFEVPLAKEMSWLLPFALISLGLMVVNSPIRIPLSSKGHKAAVLWGGWLMTCVVFFSFAGLFHAYYMIMLAPALASVVAGGAAVLWGWGKRRRVIAGLVLGVSGGLTVWFQITLAREYSVGSWWMWVAVGGLVAGLGWMAVSRCWWQAGSAVALLALLVIPAAWSWLTVLDDSPGVNLPSAYAGENDAPGPGGGETGGMETRLLDYLEANTQDVDYLLAVPSANMGAGYVIASGRPVLYMGGFSGGDPVVDAGDLAEMVENGELRYVLYGGQGSRNQGGIANWLSLACRAVPQFSQAARQPVVPPAGGGRPADGNAPGGRNEGMMTLYQCGA